MVIKVTKCGVWNFCKMIGYPLINITIIILFMIVIKMYWINSFNLTDFVLFTVLTVFAYLGITYLFDKFFNYETLSMIKENVLSFRKG